MTSRIMSFKNLATNHIINYIKQSAYFLYPALKYKPSIPSFERLFVGASFGFDHKVIKKCLVKLIVTDQLDLMLFKKYKIK